MSMIVAPEEEWLEQLDHLDRAPDVLLWLALDPLTAAMAAAEFPPPDSTSWHTFRNGPLEDGKQEGSAEIAGPVVKQILADLDEIVTPVVARALRIPDLAPDPHRTGAGIHQSGPGARLGMHVDFNVHPSDPDLVRAVNAILFLTATDGHGRLELDGFGTPPRSTSIAPQPGLIAVFRCKETGYHGHPIPMPDGAPLRKTIPAYWFRPRAAGETIDAHSTRFRDAAARP